MTKTGTLRHQRKFAWAPIRINGKFVWLRPYYHNEEYRTVAILDFMGMQIPLEAWACYPEPGNCTSLKPLVKPEPKLMDYNAAMLWLLKCNTVAERQAFKDYYEKFGHNYKLEEREYMLETLQNL